MESDRMLAIIYVVALNLGIANPGGGGRGGLRTPCFSVNIWCRSYRRGLYYISDKCFLPCT